MEQSFIVKLVPVDTGYRNHSYYCKYSVKIKSIITLFCFLMLMFQLLPVRQLGKLLFGNQVTEELAHDDCAPDCKDHFPFKKDFTHADTQVHILISEASASQYIHFTDALPKPFHGDIHTPPPNIA